MTKMTVTYKDLKNVDVMVTIMSRYNPQFWLLQKPVGYWRITVDNHKLKQVVAPFRADVPDVVA